MLFTLAAATAATCAPDFDHLSASVRQAIGDEIGFGISATKAKDMARYMGTVPADYRIVEEDGSITDRDTLRRKQTQAWAIVLRTNALHQTIDGFALDCSGTSATIRTSQRWDRQMLGRDGKSEHQVVTTQRHLERWELRGSRWLNVAIKELGGTVTVDGKPYS